MIQTILLVPVLNAQKLVGKWREKYDNSSHHGIPPHITLLFPFKDSSLINNDVINKLEDIFLNVARFSFELFRVNTFPGVIYLEPKPRERFIELTKEIVKVFPENLPYEGKFKEINPHLTLGHELEENVSFEKVKRDITFDMQNKLPISLLASEVWLMERINSEWLLKRKFDLK